MCMCVHVYVCACVCACVFSVLLSPAPPPCARILPGCDLAYACGVCVRGCTGGVGQVAIGPAVPWELHRSCHARVPEDWIVGLLQYEEAEGPAGGSSPRRVLLNAAFSSNWAYRVYEHVGSRFMVFEVCAWRGGLGVARVCLCVPLCVSVCDTVSVTPCLRGGVRKARQ